MPNYAKNDMAAAKAAREEMDRSGVGWWKAEVGDNYLRVLPPHVSMVDPTSGGHRFYHPVCLHFQVGPTKKVVPCPRRMLDKFCLICDTAFALKNSGQEEAGNDMLPSWQAYMNVIVFTTVKNEAGEVIGLEPVRNSSGEVEVKVWSASRGVLDQIFDEVEDRQATAGGYIDIADPENGYILKINRKGKGPRDTKYRVRLDQEPTPILDLVEEWDPQLLDLTQLSPAVDSEGIKSLLEGGDGDPFEKKRIPAPKPIASRFAEDEDTVDGDFRAVEAEEDAEEETESPARKLKDLIDGKKKGAKNAKA